MESWVVILIMLIIAVAIGVLVAISRISSLRHNKKYERGLKMIPLLIHLPPTTDDIDANGRDKRDIMNEAISKAGVMYSILASTITKGLKRRLYGEQHFSFEIIAHGGFIRYYAMTPERLKETVKQAIQAAYPTARVEEKLEDNIFDGGNGINSVAGAELTLNKEYYLPIATYEDTKRDASMAILNALSSVNNNEGVAVQILFRPANKKWSEKAKKYVEDTQKGKTTKTSGAGVGQFVIDVMRAPFEVPEMHEKTETTTQISSVKQEELNAITNKMRYPAFETLIRIIASSDNRSRSEAIVGGVVSAFSQFDSPE